MLIYLKLLHGNAKNVSMEYQYYPHIIAKTRMIYVHRSEARRTSSNII